MKSLLGKSEGQIYQRICERVCSQAGRIRARTGQALLQDVRLTSKGVGVERAQNEIDE
jgi:hypothetical protein